MFIFPTHTPREVEGGMGCALLYLQSKGSLRTRQGNGKRAESAEKDGDFTFDSRNVYSEVE